MQVEAEYFTAQEQTEFHAAICSTIRALPAQVPCSIVNTGGSGTNPDSSPFRVYVHGIMQLVHMLGLRFSDMIGQQANNTISVANTGPLRSLTSSYLKGNSECEK